MSVTKFTIFTKFTILTKFTIFTNFTKFTNGSHQIHHKLNFFDLNLFARDCSASPGKPPGAYFYLPHASRMMCSPPLALAPALRTTPSQGERPRLPFCA